MKAGWSISFTLFAIGCASQPAPRAEVASAMAALRGAEEAGASTVPQASLHEKLAEEQLTAARNLMEKGRNERARSAAVRAYQDAELAIALARESQANQQLESFVANHPRATSGGSAGESGESTAQ